MKRTLRTYTRLTVSLDAHHVGIAKEIGDGFASRGVQRALDSYPLAPAPDHSPVPKGQHTPKPRRGRSNKQQKER